MNQEGAHRREHALNREGKRWHLIELIPARGPFLVTLPLVTLVDEELQKLDP